jgi:hypothetical protein
MQYYLESTDLPFGFRSVNPVVLFFGTASTIPGRSCCVSNPLRTGSDIFRQMLLLLLLLFILLVVFRVHTPLEP